MAACSSLGDGMVMLINLILEELPVDAGVSLKSNERVVRILHSSIAGERR